MVYFLLCMPCLPALYLCYSTQDPSTAPYTDRAFSELSHPLFLPIYRCLRLSDPTALHLSGTPARRSSLPPQEEKTAHQTRPIRPLLRSAVPPPTPGGPEGHFSQHGHYGPRPRHTPLISLGQGYTLRPQMPQNRSQKTNPCLKYLTFTFTNQ